MKIKKLIASLLCAVMLLSALPLTAFAEEYAAFTGDGKACISAPSAERYYAYIEGGTAALEKYVDIDAFEDYLFKKLYNCEKKIDISSYSLPATTAITNAISSLICDEMMEAFHVDLSNTLYWYNTSTNKYTYLELAYKYSASEYQSMYAECMETVDDMVFDIKDNNNLSDMEKALILHDRVALACQYNYETYKADATTDADHNMYGVFALGIAVCEGYAQAYDYLLEEVGIESEICISNALNHAWNIVTIDGAKYHVDVTWDDPTVYSSEWDVKGRVLHDNFLCSSSEFLKTHVATDYSTAPSSTKYDNYFWKNSDTAFQLVNDKIYYVDNVNKALKCYTTSSTLMPFGAVWYISNTTYYTDNYSTLASDGRYLYYNSPTAIYRYDPVNSSTIQVTSFTMSNYNSIYGLAYEGTRLVYDINTDANFTGSNMYRNSINYDVAPPQMKAVSTYSASAFQTVTLTLKDNAGVAGYWFGTNSDYTQNTYYADTDGKATIKVSAPGRYYITSKDINGNITSHYYYYFDYNKLTLNANGGIVSPAYIVTINGKQIKMPTAVKGGYIFKGWSTSATASSGSTYITPSADTTYYAVWQLNTSPSLYYINGVWYYYVNGKLDTSNTLCSYNGKWYHVNGGKRVYDTTLVKYGNYWYYVKNGIKNNSNTLVQYGSKWYHVNGGKRVYDTTLVKYNSKWYYVKNGIKNNSNTLCKYNGKWYHVNNGKWVKDTTLVKYNGTWYYVKGGIKNNSNTLVKYNNKWYHVNKGKRVKDTAIVKYNGKRYYVKGGILQRVTKTVKVNGKYYKLKNGVVV